MEAAKLLGIDAVPTCRLSHLSDADKRAYVLTDNKLAEKAGWDRELLAIELQGLIELDVNIELTGFEMAEVDLILEEAREATDAASGPEDAAPELSPGPAVTQTGDLWLLGTHRLLCGDARDKAAYDQLLEAPRRNSCSPIRLITSPSMAMFAGSATFVIANLRWAPAR